MSITDELREAITWFVDSQRDRFSAIADRIDEQCERELTMARGEAVQHLGSEVAKKYVKLPVDADGVTIHLGDMLEIEHGHGVLDSGEVTDIHLQVGKCAVSIGFGDEEGVTAYPEDYRHVQPDSWESIISDATALGSQMKRRTYQTGDLVERCKRLAGEVE